MLTVFVYFLPLVVCLVWLMLYKFKRKNELQIMLNKLLYFGVFYCFFFAIYLAPLTNYSLLARIDGISMTLTVFYLPIIFRYIFAHLNDKLEKWKFKNVLYLPALVFACAISVLYYLYGFENAAQLYQNVDDVMRNAGNLDKSEEIYSLFANRVEKIFYFFDTTVFAAICGSFLLAIIVCCIFLSWKLGYQPGDIYRFFFKNKATVSARTISFCSFIIISDLAVLNTLRRPFIISHEYIGITISIVFAVALFCLCYVEYFNTLPIITLSALTHIDINIIEGEAILENPSDSDDVNEEKEMKIIESMPYARNKWSAEHSDTSAALINGLKRYVVDEKAFRNPELTREMVARHLNTNRTTLSFALNILMATTFKSYLANIRIEEAKKYMLKHPTATLDYVADECGFRDAASFGHKFKDVEGVSPKIWLVGAMKSAN